MRNKVLVIGATGKAGVEVVRALSARGVEVHGATRAPETARSLEKHRATPIAFDYDDPSTWTAALSEVDRIFLSARPADVSPETVIHPFLDRAREAGVHTIAFMTAMGVEANEELGLRKAERYLEGLGLRHTFIRPNWFHQNFLRGMFFETIATSGNIIVPAEEGSVSFVDARDIASVAAASLTEEGHSGKEYTLTGPESLSFSQVAAILSKVSGKKIQYSSVSDGDARGALAGSGHQPHQIEFMLHLFAAIRQGWSASVTTDVKDVTGGDPISLAQFAEEHAHVWK